MPNPQPQAVPAQSPSATPDATRAVQEAPRAPGAADAMRSGARGQSYAGAQATLSPAPAQPASLASAMPNGVSLNALRLWFDLPAGKVLSSDWKSEVRTKYQSRVGLEVSGGSIRLWCSPSVHVDAIWPVQNMSLWGASYDFATGQTNVDVSLVGGLGQGFVDRRNSVRDTVRGLVSSGLNGSAVSKPGYNPLQDPNIHKTLESIAANFAALPSAGGTAAVGAHELQNVSAGATLALRDGFTKEAGGGGVIIPPGGVFSVVVNGGGTLADVAQSRSLAQGAQAARIRSLTLTSKDVTLTHKGEPILQLERLEVLPGGVVTVTDFELLGKARTAAGFESLLYLLGGTIGYAARGVPPELGARVAATQANPQIVPGLAKDEVEKALTAAVQALLSEHAHAVPGINLAEIMGVHSSGPVAGREPGAGG